MNTDDVIEAVTEIVKENFKVSDEGIGYFEFWGATGTDKRMVATCEDSIEIDVTDLELYDEDGNKIPVTKENMDLNELNEFSVSVTKSGGGDPDACAESGRKRCGSCRGCDETSADFTVTLKSVTVKDDKVTASFDAV